MNRELKQFFIRILITVALLATAGWIIFSFVTPGKYLPVLPWMLAFFALFTIGMHAFQLRLAKKNMSGFVRYSMLVTLIRLFVYSLFAIVYLYLNTSNAAVFVVCLVVVYLVFTILEVAELSRFLQKKNRK
jgi:hypothetical protein